jgi:hypothetical protein
MSKDETGNPPEDKPKKRGRGRPFLKGEAWTGNRGGRPKSEMTIVQRCRDLSHDMIDIAEEIARDKKAPAKTRLDAVQFITERGYGKAVQPRINNDTLHVEGGGNILLRVAQSNEERDAEPARHNLLVAEVTDAGLKRGLKGDELGHHIRNRLIENGVDEGSAGLSALLMMARLSNEGEGRSAPHKALPLPPEDKAAENGFTDETVSEVVRVPKLDAKLVPG